MPILKVKLFHGGYCRGSVEDKFNEWSKNNPNIGVVDIKYQYVQGGEHSLLVVYTEVEDAD